MISIRGTTVFRGRTDTARVWKGQMASSRPGSVHMDWQLGVVDAMATLGPAILGANCQSI